MVMVVLVFMFMFLNFWFFFISTLFFNSHLSILFSNLFRFFSFCSLSSFFFSFFMLLVSLFLMGLLIFLMLSFLVVRLVEFSRNIPNTGPIFYNFFMLATHFNKESTVKNFAIKAISNKVNSIDFHLEDNLEWSRIIVFNLNKLVFRKSFLNIFFSSFKVAFYQIEGNMLDIIIKSLNLFNHLFPLGVVELSLLVLTVHIDHRIYF